MLARDLPGWELADSINTQRPAITRSWQLSGTPSTKPPCRIGGALSVSLFPSPGIVEAAALTGRIATIALDDAHFPDIHIWDGGVLQVELTTPALGATTFLLPHNPAELIRAGWLMMGVQEG